MIYMQVRNDEGELLGLMRTPLMQADLKSPSPPPFVSFVPSLPTHVVLCSEESYRLPVFERIDFRLEQWTNGWDRWWILVKPPTLGEADLRKIGAFR